MGDAKMTAIIETRKVPLRRGRKPYPGVCDTGCHLFENRFARESSFLTNGSLITIDASLKRKTKISKIKTIVMKEDEARK